MNFPKIRRGGGGPKAVWTFSQKTSKLEDKDTPKWFRTIAMFSTFYVKFPKKIKRRSREIPPTDAIVLSFRHRQTFLLQEEVLYLSGLDIQAP